MATNTISSATTTNLKGTVPDFIVQSKALDTAENTGKQYYYFEDATKYYGYYLKIAFVNSAANALATWAFGKGWTAGDDITSSELKHITGMGKDTFQQIAWNHNVVKNVVGDAFCRIIMDKSKQKLLNIVPISPERVRLEHENGRILKYDVWNGKEWKAVPKEEMLHSSCNRIGDQVHGTSRLEATQEIIDSLYEALEDGRAIQHRSKALGIAYYKTDNTGKIAYANSQIEKAVKNGEMLGLPDGTVEIKEFPSKTTADRQAWIQSLENQVYQTFGVPRSIVSSDGTSEVGGKMGHVIFEPIYTREQSDFEADLLNQVGRTVTFNRPPSLGGLMNETEGKNTGQLNIQPNDTQANLSRE